MFNSSSVPSFVHGAIAGYVTFALRCLALAPDDRPTPAEIEAAFVAEAPPSERG